jgi:hypothetical protein
MFVDTGVERKRASVALAPLGRARSGALGNGRLTALTGAVLLVLLAVEGATIPSIRSLLSVHIFVGMLLLGPVALKLASTGYRMARYYLGGAEYRRLGPPAPLMRVLVAPVLVLSTLTLFGTGVLLLAVPRRGLVLGLHKASFVVWFGAMSIHVIAYALRTGRHVLEEAGGMPVRGTRMRLLVVSGALVAGIAVASLTYHLGGAWFHSELR